eukprot:1305-Heterococcus_DN1.PRE.3
MPSPCVLALASSMRTLPLRARQSGSSSGCSSAQGECMHMRVTTVQYTILHYTTQQCTGCWHSCATPFHVATASQTVQRSAANSTGKH